jgi:hypothetical protein
MQYLPPRRARERWMPMSTQSRLDLPGIHCTNASGLLGLWHQDARGTEDTTGDLGTGDNRYRAVHIGGGVCSVELAGLELAI